MGLYNWSNFAKDLVLQKNQPDTHQRDRYLLTQKRIFVKGIKHEKVIKTFGVQINQDSNKDPFQSQFDIEEVECILAQKYFHLLYC